MADWERADAAGGRLVRPCDRSGSVGFSKKHRLPPGGGRRPQAARARQITVVACRVAGTGSDRGLVIGTVVDQPGPTSRPVLAAALVKRRAVYRRCLPSTESFEKASYRGPARKRGRSPAWLCLEAGTEYRRREASLGHGPASAGLDDHLHRDVYAGLSAAGVSCGHVV